MLTIVREILPNNTFYYQTVDLKEQLQEPESSVFILSEHSLQTTNPNRY